MGNLSRKEGWERRLAALLSEAASRPFKWGVWDCGIFAMAACEALTGAAPFTVPEGAYDTALSSRRWMARQGWEDMGDAFDALLGERLASPLLSGRGDIVIADAAELGEAAGVVDLTGERIGVLSPDGLIYLPLTSALDGWKV